MSILHFTFITLHYIYIFSKSPSRVWDRDEGVAGRNGREKYFPEEGSLICFPGKSMIFYKKKTEKIELVARPGQHLISFAKILYSQGGPTAWIRTPPCSLTTTLSVSLRQRPVSVRSSSCPPLSLQAAETIVLKKAILSNRGNLLGLALSPFEKCKG